MAEIMNLKCKCCECYDSYEGCCAFDCSVDFKLSLSKVSEVARQYNMSSDWILGLINAINARNESEEHDDDDDILPDDFNPFCDSKFIVSVEDDSNFGSRLLVEMPHDMLKQMRAEIDLILEEYNDNSNANNGV